MTSENVLTFGEFYLRRCPPDAFPHPVAASVLEKLAGFIDAGLGHGWWAIDSWGRPEGVFFGIFMPDLFSDEWCAQELFWHTLPCARKGGAGMKLFRAFLAEAKRQGCKDVLVGYQMTDQNQFLEKIYHRMGFKLIAKGYKKAI